MRRTIKAKVSFTAIPSLRLNHKFCTSRISLQYRLFKTAIVPNTELLCFPCSIQELMRAHSSLTNFISAGIAFPERAHNENLHANGFGPLILGLSLLCFTPAAMHIYPPARRPADDASCQHSQKLALNQSVSLLHPCARARGAALMHSLPWLPIT